MDSKSNKRALAVGRMVRSFAAENIVVNSRVFEEDGVGMTDDVGLEKSFSFNSVANLSGYERISPKTKITWNIEKHVEQAAMM